MREAAEESALLRLRPVMMTMIATIVGGVPLVFSSGAGSEAREALGYVIVGGLGLATFSTLYITPVAYHPRTLCAAECRTHEPARTRP